jgi:hypothetical protein
VAGGNVNPTFQTGITTETPVDIAAYPTTEYIFVGWTVTAGTATLADANNANTTVIFLTLSLF